MALALALACHTFMAAVAEGLAARKVATLRYQLPFMEQGSNAQIGLRRFAVRGREVVRRSHDLQGSGPTPLPQVRGLIFFGFPLHAANLYQAS